MHPSPSILCSLALLVTIAAAPAQDSLGTYRGTIRELEDGSWTTRTEFIGVPTQVPTVALLQLGFRCIVF